MDNGKRNDNKQPRMQLCVSSTVWKQNLTDKLLEGEEAKIFPVELKLTIYEGQATYREEWRDEKCLKWFPQDFSVVRRSIV